MSDAIYDVAVVGMGVVGAGIARELSKYELKVLLLEREDDVGAGISKGNSAIMHTGFDAKPGTLESACVRDGSRLFREQVAPALGIPFEEVGAILVARTDDEVARIPAILEKAARNGVPDVRPMDLAEMRRREPHLAATAKAGVFVPRESITCPFTTPLAYVTQALANGATLSLETEVTGVAVAEDGVTEIATSRGAYRTRYLVNSAGLYADRIDAWLGYGGYTVNPRKGEFIIYDKHARRLVRHILLQVPTPHTKGILICPTIFGNVLLGPTADDHRDPEDAGTTREGLARIQAAGRHLLPDLVDGEDITALYAGNRSATEHAEYQVFFHGDKRYVTVGGIRSTGLSASLALARHVVEGLRDIGLALREKGDFRDVRMASISEFRERPYQCADRIRANPEYGRIVCFCEKVSEQEIRDAFASPIPARSLGALKRRTRATTGRCQGFTCLPAVLKALAAAHGLTLREYFERENAAKETI